MTHSPKKLELQNVVTPGLLSLILPLFLALYGRRGKVDSGWIVVINSLWN